MSDAEEVTEKIQEVQKLIEEALRNDRWHIDESVHAELRKQQRNITDADIREVILYGDREADQDRWNDKWKHWTYALRNRDVDGCDIRIIFDVESYPDVVVVTVMHVYP
jgi:hypothetical protein